MKSATTEPASADRETALCALRHLLPPSEVLIRANGSRTTFIIALHAVETLMRIAHPLPRMLRRRLEPWVLKADHRRRVVLRVARALEAARKSRRGARVRPSRRVSHVPRKRR